MVVDRDSRILDLSRQIATLSVELDRLLHIRADSPSVPSASTHRPIPPSPPSTPQALPLPANPRSYTEFIVGDIVEITNRYGGNKGKHARILNTDAKETFALELLSTGESLSKRKWNVRFVRRISSTSA